MEIAGITYGCISAWGEWEQQEGQGERMDGDPKRPDPVHENGKSSAHHGVRSKKTVALLGETVERSPSWPGEYLGNRSINHHSYPQRRTRRLPLAERPKKNFRVVLGKRAQ